MKKSISSLGISLLLVFGSLTFTNCGGAGEPAETEASQQVIEGDNKDQLAEASVYQCSMHCEGDKTYDVAGSCPKCGMDLKEISGDKDHDHDQEDDHGDHEHEE